MLVQLDKDYTAQQLKEKWEDWYAERVVSDLGS